jgi:hypothetical protein
VTFIARNAAVFMLYFSSTLLLHLKVGPTKGKKDTKLGFSLGVSSIWGGLRAQICLLL